MKAKVTWDWGCLGREDARQIIRCVGAEEIRMMGGEGDTGKGAGRQSCKQCQDHD